MRETIFKSLFCQEDEIHFSTFWWLFKKYNFGIKKIIAIFSSRGTKRNPAGHEIYVWSQSTNTQFRISANLLEDGRSLHGFFFPLKNTNYEPSYLVSINNKQLTIKYMLFYTIKFVLLHQNENSQDAC